jgi:hypothetical protein
VIISAMTPLYNHVLVALLVTGDDLRLLYKEICSFLWTKTVNAEALKKRRLVA